MFRDTSESTFSCGTFSDTSELQARPLCPELLRRPGSGIIVFLGTWAGLEPHQGCGLHRLCPYPDPGSAVGSEQTPSTGYPPQRLPVRRGALWALGVTHSPCLLPGYHQVWGVIPGVGLLVFCGKAKALREDLSLQGQEASNALAKKLPGTLRGRGVWGTDQCSPGATHRE